MKWLYRQLSLPILMPRLRFLSPWLLLVSLILFIWTVWSVVHAPVDVQQGEVYRIIYAHVPMAALSMMIYTGLGLSSLLYLVFRFKLCDRVNQAIAPVGLVFSNRYFINRNDMGSTDLGHLVDLGCQTDFGIHSYVAVCGVLWCKAAVVRSQAKRIDW